MTSTYPPQHPKGLDSNASSLLKAAQAEPVALSSSALLQGRKAVAITHNGMLYTLQNTKLGKLILTK